MLVQLFHSKGFLLAIGSLQPARVDLSVGSLAQQLSNLVFLFEVPHNFLDKIARLIIHMFSSSRIQVRLDFVLVFQRIDVSSFTLGVLFRAFAILCGKFTIIRDLVVVYSLKILNGEEVTPLLGFEMRILVSLIYSVSRALGLDWRVVSDNVFLCQRSHRFTSDLLRAVRIL